MKYRRQLIGILRFALTLVLFGALVPEASAPEADQQLVAYFVTWHATARGFGRHVEEFATGWMVKHFAETTGSAIVRFARDRWGDLLLRDTRYLYFVEVDKREAWSILSPAELGCNSYSYQEIIDPSANSGLSYTVGGGTAAHPNPPQLLPKFSRRPDGLAVFEEPFYALAYLQFTRHGIIIVTPGPGTDAKSCNGVRDETFKSGGVFYIYPDFPETQEAQKNFVLQAITPKDDSFFSMNVRFSHHSTKDFGGGVVTNSPDYTERVEWTAEAHRLGKCPCAVNSSSLLSSGLAWASPATSPVYINYDDQGLVSGQVKEVVTVQPLWAGQRFQPETLPEPDARGTKRKAILASRPL